MPLESEGALFVSILVATLCTLVEGVLAHTFSETIGSGVVDDECESGEVKWIVEVVDDVIPRQSIWGSRNSAYTLMQSVHSTQDSNINDKYYQNTDSRLHNPRRLDASNFLQSIH
jgi:hypothetical protein